MLHYPKIPGSRNTPDGRCVAFEKYDGTTFRYLHSKEYFQLAGRAGRGQL